MIAERLTAQSCGCNADNWNYSILPSLPLNSNMTSRFRYCCVVSRLVAVHGIGQQMKGANSIHADWFPAIRDGLARVGCTAFGSTDLIVAFYGDLFRPRGAKTLGSAPLVPADLDEEIELPLLTKIWEELASVEAQLDGPGTAAKVRTSRSAQRALLALSTSKFFAGLSERLLIADLKQVSAYFKDPRVRTAVRERVEAAITADTRALVGHSLGSVVAYEVLAAKRCTGITTLVTLGSPLGIPNIVFDRLRPQPNNGRGTWPLGVHTWVNIADRGDVVALQKELAPLFGDRLRDRRVYNGATAHDARPYLTSIETGEALAKALGNDR